MNFNIEYYLNSLPEDIKEIDVSYKNLTYLPDLSRFKNLERLCCDYNRLTSLPKLNKNLKRLYCCDNQLTSLPPLNEKLQMLSCSSNQLTMLPVLNKNLKRLYCFNNQLTSLPVLNKKLQNLSCSNNKLTSLPTLNEKLQGLDCSYNLLTSLPNLNKELGNIFCYNNPIAEIIYISQFSIMKKNIKILNNFRYLYFCLKYKKRLWEIRKSIIMKKYHPNYLMNLTEDDDLDEILETW
jgi:Leucine-rich repeat (LRR) protein